MAQYIYLIRHCEAEGQPPEAPLTEKGQQDAFKIATFLKDEKIEVIYSSPFVRAVQTAAPLASQLNLRVHTDDRLTERVLSSQNLQDWFTKLELTFKDLHVKFEGGESSQEAMDRGVGAIQSILATTTLKSAVVTHGNLMALILQHFEHTNGFETWKALTNPDVFLLTFENNSVSIKRLWA